MISRIDIEDMTGAQDELGKALALIRENSAAPSVPWTGEEFTHTLMPDDMCAAVATILNAAVSGDLARPSQAGDERVARLVEAATKVAGVTIGGRVMDDPKTRKEFPLLTEAFLELRAALAAMKDGG